MAIRIVDVNITTDYSWEDIKNLADWNAVRLTNNNWNKPFQTTTVGKLIAIEVEVSENNWSSIKDNHNNWQEIKNRFNTWQDIKNY